MKKIILVVYLAIAAFFIGDSYIYSIRPLGYENSVYEDEVDKYRYNEAFYKTILLFVVIGILLYAVLLYLEKRKKPSN
jgi:hypothetical protein